MSSTENLHNPAPFNVGVLVMSCDAYSDLWQSFFTLFDRYWSDCPFPIYLSSNFKVFEHSKVNNISTKRVTNWSDEMREALRQFPYDYIIYFQEDYFLRENINTQTIIILFNILLEHNAAYLRLMPFPPPDKKLPNTEGVGVIANDASYRTSLQTAIWKKKSFEDLLKDNESPWAFELNSPYRSAQLPDLFLSVTNPHNFSFKKGIFPVSYIATAVVKGQLLRRTIRHCLKESISLDISARPVQSFWGEMSLLQHEFYFRHLQKPNLNTYFTLKKGSIKMLSFLSFRKKRALDFQEQIRFFFDKINRKENFTLARYADGERAVLRGIAIKGIDGWATQNVLSKLGKDLWNTVNHSESNYYYGISCPCCDKNAFSWYLKFIPHHDNLTFSNLFVNDNYRFFQEYFPKIEEQAIVIAHRNGLGKPIGNLEVIRYYSTENNCIEYWDTEGVAFVEKIINETKSFKNMLFVISAGPMSEVIIHRLYEANPENRYIDFGSAIDAYIHARMTRSYMDDTQIFSQKICKISI